MNAAKRKNNYFFGPFRLDPINQCLWRGERRLSLRPKTFAVLCTLIDRAGQLVTKEELLDTVWSDTYVTDGVLRFCVRELRKVLKDKSRTPRFIETVHRRGYRFIAPLATGTQPVSRSKIQVSHAALSRSPESLTPSFVEAVRQAADTFLRGGAYHEAIHCLTRGLELLKTVPDTHERAQQELALWVVLAHALRATKGFAAPEVEQVYTRVRELWQQMGDTAQLFPVLWGLGAGYAVGAELHTARELGEQLLRLAQSIRDPALLLETHMLYGSVLVWHGELIAGRAHVEQGIALHDSQRYDSHAFVYGQDPGVVCRVMASYALWLLGYPDQALQCGQESFALAQEQSHPFSLAFARNWITMLHLFRREWQTAQQQAETAVAFSREQGFAHLEAVAMALQGGALVEEGRAEKGIIQLRQGLAACRATGAELLRPYLLALLAQAQAMESQLEEGLRALTEALDVAQKTGEQWWEAELYRIKGELLRQMDSRSRMEATSAGWFRT